MPKKKIPRKRASRGRLADGSANPIDKHVGLRLRHRRLLVGLSQHKLGEALGVTFQQVQKYERGANRINGSRLYDIAKILRVDVGYFFEELSDSAKALAPSKLAMSEKPVIAGDDLGSEPGEPTRTYHLVRAYYGIASDEIRSHFLHVVRAIGDAEIASST